jgi:hypothetical protein
MVSDGGGGSGGPGGGGRVAGDGETRAGDSPVGAQLAVKEVAAHRSCSGGAREKGRQRSRA